MGAHQDAPIIKTIPIPTRSVILIFLRKSSMDPAEMCEWVHSRIRQSQIIHRFSYRIDSANFRNGSNFVDHP